MSREVCKHLFHEQGLPILSSHLVLTQASNSHLWAWRTKLPRGEMTAQVREQECRALHDPRGQITMGHGPKPMDQLPVRINKVLLRHSHICLHNSNAAALALQWQC